MSVRHRPWAGLLVTVAVVLTSLVVAPPAVAAGTVTVVVQGQGSVAGDGIDCYHTGGPDCSQFYPNGEECTDDLPPVCFPSPPVRELTASPGTNGFAFDSFQNCDEVTERTCTVTVSSPRTVTATFIDVASPIVAIPTPSSGAHAGTVTLSTTASDNNGVKRVEFRVGNVLVGTDTSAPYSVAFNSLSMSDGVASVTATAVDLADRTATSPQGQFTIDNTAPGVVVTGPDAAVFGPGDTQVWGLTMSDATSGVVIRSCAVTPAGSTPTFVGCSGPSSHEVTGLAEGSYEFRARAIDAAGNSTTSAVRTFTIDATPPASTILGGPADGSVIGSRTATFTLSSTEPGSTFACRAYPVGDARPAFGSCTSPAEHVLTGLADGSHTVEVLATDAVGNAEDVPAMRTFTVDGTAPETGFTKKPKAVVKTTKRKVTVRFGFASTEPGSTFRCRLDGRAWKDCPANGRFKVKRGKHTLQVASVDAIGNVDATPATYRWKVRKKR